MTIIHTNNHRSLKVLFVNRPDTFSVPGGDTNHMMSLKNGLDKLGVFTGVDCSLFPNPAGYDIIYVVNLLLPFITLRQVAAIRAHTNAPIVLMPLYWDRSEALWGEAIVQDVFSNAKTERERESLLKKVAEGTLDYKNYSKSKHNYPGVDYELMQREVLQYVDHLIPISNLEMDSIKRVFNTPNIPCSVINAGADLVNRRVSPKMFTDAYHVSDFILISGRVEQRKNQLMLLEALKDTNLPIVVAGGQPDKKYLELCKKIASPNTHFIGRVSDEMLASARSAARVHALPSWWECAGLSSMEAAMADCNVVMGSHGAEPEYFGDGPYYCDPSDVNSVRQAVLDAYNNYHLDEDKRTAIKNRLINRYNWDKISRDTYHVIQTVFTDYLHTMNKYWINRRSKREIALAHEFYYKGDKATALNILEPYINNSNTDISSFILVGMIFIDFGLYEKAIKILEYATRLDPDNVAIQRHLSKALLAANQFDAAEKVLNKVLSLYKDDDVSLNQLALLQKKRAYSVSGQEKQSGKDGAKMIRTHGRSIIIVTYNNEETIEQCLLSLFPTLNHQDEIVLVDNASSDGTLAKVGEQFFGKANCHLFENSENLGFSEATNIGIQNSHGNVIVLLNPDTMVSREWLDRMEFHLNKSSDIAAVGPISNYAAGNQNMDKYLKGKLTNVSSTDSISDEFYAWNKGKSVTTKLLTGFCLMVKYDVLNELDFLDPMLFLGNDDLDLCWRLRLNNYHLIVASDVFIYHIGQHSFNKSSKSITRKLVQESTDFLYNKLKNYYGESQIPAPMELWGINWFVPTVNVFNPNAKLHKVKPNFPNGMHQNTELVSIVMLTYNALDFTKKTIQSILENTDYPYEIIFVDNNSSDGTQNYLKELIINHSDFSLIQNPKNLGFAAGNNQGAKLAKGNYLLFLNNDILVSQEWLADMMNAIRKDESIGMVGPMTNVISGRQMYKDIPYTDDQGFYRFAHEVKKVKKGVITPRRRIAGFAMLMKKAVFEKIGGFDESFGTGNFEDDDLCLRTRETGYAIMVDESTFIHHFGSQSFKANKIDYVKNIQERMKIFQDKWPTVDYSRLLEINRSLVDDQKDELDKADVFLENEDIEKAEPIYRNIVLENPLCQPALYGLSMVDYAKGNYSESLKRLKGLLKLNPQYLKAYNLLGMICYASTQYDQAELFFRKAVALQQENIDAHQNLAETLFALKKFDEAEAKFLENSILFPNEINPLIRVAQLNAGKGNPKEAVRFLESALQLNPGNSHVQEMLSVMKNYPGSV